MWRMNTTGIGKVSSMDRATVSYRPIRDSKRVRRFYGSQLILGLMWSVWGGWSFIDDGTFPRVIGGILLAAGLCSLAFCFTSWCAGIAADRQELRWRGLFRSATVPWELVTRLVLDDRTSPYGTKVGIEVDTIDGNRRSVPSDALDGLADDNHIELRRRLFESLADLAEQANVPVTVPSHDDPLIS